jgi:excinuclease UvrABC ATPase subunit
MATSTQHPADTHDLIRVQGARENNLKDVSIEIPKRRLTVFTGVSGSGKSSLVFSTIAAESQRLINAMRGDGIGQRHRPVAAVRRQQVAE